MKTMKQRGDTIVEVMLAMAIIGAVLGGAFGIANRNVRIAQASKERTDALKVAESEVELLKAGPNNGLLGPGVTEICIRYDGATSNVLSHPAGHANCMHQELYEVKIIKPTVTTPDLYTVVVNWEQIGTSTTEPGELKLYYKLP